MSTPESRTPRPGPWHRRALRALRAADDARALALAAAAPPSPERAALLARALLAQDRLADAGAVLDEAVAAWGPATPALVDPLRWLARERATGARIRAARAAARRTIAALPHAPHPATLAGDDELVVCPHPGADTVVVSFGLWLPMAATDRVLASAGCARVHIRDLQTRFRADPAAVLRDRERLDAAILDACRATGAPRMILTGASGQALGALYWATRLRADGALAFSPISTLDPAVLAAMADDRRDRAILAPVLASEGPVAELDALACLQRTPLPVRVVSGAEHLQDRAHARRLAAAPCVRLTLLPGVGHEAAAAAIVQGLIPELLNGLREAG